MKVKKIFLTFIIFYLSTILYAQNWEKLEGLSGLRITSIAVTSNNFLYAATRYNGIYKTTNHGEEWEKTNLDFPAILNLGVDSSDRIYAGGFKEGVFLSTDYGETWNMIEDLENFQGAAYAFGSNGNMFISTYAFTQGQIFRSTNDGVDWEMKYYDLNYPFHSMVVNNNGYIFACNTTGLILSTDNGENWNPIGYVFYQANSLVVDSSNTIYAGTSLGIYKSNNNGTDWINIFQNYTNTILLDKNGIIYAGTGGNGVYKSEDNGNSWDSINSGLTNYNINKLISDSENNIYALTDSGLFRNNFSAVPVELNSFTAKNISNNIHLSWSTATETNNKGFEIYRKNREDRSQNLEWKLLDFVEGKGTTTENQNYSFVDNNILSGKYIYKLKQIDFDGNYKYSEEVEIEIIPNRYYLSQNYPNPFNPTTTIEYQIKNREKVLINIYNSLGELVIKLLDEEKESGTYEVVWDGRDSYGKPTASGIYYYRIAIHSDKITAGEFLDVKKMIYLK